MKTSRSNPSKQNSQGTSKKPRPEIRDDLDSHKDSSERKNGKVKTAVKKKAKK